jgi:hypothetical protein
LFWHRQAARAQLTQTTALRRRLLAHMGRKFDMFQQSRKSDLFQGDFCCTAQAVHLHPCHRFACRFCALRESFRAAQT